MMIRIAVVLLLAGIVLSQKPVLQLCEKPQTDMKCMMVCELTDHTDQLVTIYHGQTEVAACANENECQVKDAAYIESDSMISWHSHGNMTMVHFSIKSLNIPTNEGKWKCSSGSISSDKKHLTIYSKPTTCHLMKVGDGENATLECHVNCAYPQSEVQVQLLIDNKATTEMSTKTDGNSANCKYKEEKSLTYTWPVTFKSGASYTCECSMAAIGWTSSGMLEKKDPSGANITIIVAIVAIVVFVIIAIVIAIILIKKRRNAKGGARVPTKEPEDEREF